MRETVVMATFRAQPLEAVLPTLRHGGALRRRSWPPEQRICIAEGECGELVLEVMASPGSRGLHASGPREYQLTVDDLTAIDWEEA